MIAVRELAEAIGASFDGPDRAVTRLCPPGRPAPGGLTIADDDAAVARTLAAPGADALAGLLVADDAEVPRPHPPLLRHPAPRLALARASRRLDREPVPAPGVAPGAVVADDAVLGAGVAVAPGAIVGHGARLADGCVVDAGAVVGDGCELGADTRLFPRVVLYPGVRIGARCRVHAGAVIGADGFGYAPGPAGAEKIHHLGGVRIGDEVEIGANTCVDRGTLGDTEIGDGSKLDDLVQVGHNVRIGRHCLIVGHAAIGGSTVVEDGVIVGGAVAISDHVTVHAGARLAGRAGVTKSVPAGETWGGFPAAPLRAWTRRLYLLGRLERIWAHVRAAEKDADG